LSGKVTQNPDTRRYPLLPQINSAGRAEFNAHCAFHPGRRQFFVGTWLSMRTLSLARSSH